jgi:hypothetical protein
VSRGFNTTYGTNSNDSVITAASLTDSRVRSFGFWINVDAWSTQNQIMQTGGPRINSDGTPILTMQAAQWATPGLWTITPPTDYGTWHHFLFTYDSNATANDPLIYLDGVSQTVTRATGPAGGYTGATAAYYLGNRTTLGRAILGRMAEFAIWNAILDPAEAMSLGDGFSPLLIRPASLVEYVPMVSGTVTSRKRAPPTVSGALDREHPRVFNPTDAQIGRPIPAATFAGARFVSAPDSTAQQQLAASFVTAALITGAAAAFVAVDGRHTQQALADQPNRSEFFQGIPPKQAAPASYVAVDGRHTQQAFADQPNRSQFFKGVPPSITAPYATSERWLQTTPQFYSDIASSLTKQFFGPQFVIQERVDAPAQDPRTQPSQIRPATGLVFVSPQQPTTQRPSGRGQDYQDSPSRITVPRFFNQPPITQRLFAPQQAYVDVPGRIPLHRYFSRAAIPPIALAPQQFYTDAPSQIRQALIPQIIVLAQRPTFLAQLQQFYQDVGSYFVQTDQGFYVPAPEPPVVVGPPGGGKHHPGRATKRKLLPMDRLDEWRDVAELSEDEWAILLAVIAYIEDQL